MQDNHHPTENNGLHGLRRAIYLNDLVCIIILQQLGTVEVAGFCLSELGVCFSFHPVAEIILAWQRHTLELGGDFFCF